MRTARFALIVPLALAAVVGCVKYTIVPPEVDLSRFDTVALVTFKTEGAKGDLDALATQFFLQEITAAQRVPVLELGPAAEVLAGVGQSSVNPEAITAIGQRHGVGAVFVGEIKISRVKPHLDVLAPVSRSLLVRATFDISVTARLLSASNGATIWTDSVLREGTVGALHLGPDGLPSFGIRDKDEAMISLLRQMMFQLTWDFRPTRRRL